jgi:hypothetical protein
MSFRSPFVSRSLVSWLPWGSRLLILQVPATMIFCLTTVHSNGDSQHGLKPLKPGAKINLSSLFFSGTLHRNGKLTKTDKFWNFLSNIANSKVEFPIFCSLCHSIPNFKILGEERCLPTLGWGMHSWIRQKQSGF